MNNTEFLTITKCPVCDQDLDTEECDTPQLFWILHTAFTLPFSDINNALSLLHLDNSNFVTIEAVNGHSSEIQCGNIRIYYGAKQDISVVIFGDECLDCECSLCNNLSSDWTGLIKSVVKAGGNFTILDIEIDDTNNQIPQILNNWFPDEHMSILKRWSNAQNHSPNNSRETITFGIHNSDLSIEFHKDNLEIWQPLDWVTIEIKPHGHKANSLAKAIVENDFAELRQKIEKVNLGARDN